MIRSRVIYEVFSQSSLLIDVLLVLDFHNAVRYIRSTLRKVPQVDEAKPVKRIGAGDGCFQAFFAECPGQVDDDRAAQRNRAGNARLSNTLVLQFRLKSFYVGDRNIRKK